MREEEFAKYEAEDAGYCTFCKEVTMDSGVEPDAEDYLCPKCKDYTVMGMQQALAMGFISFDE
jgi:hypothetical protein